MLKKLLIFTTLLCSLSSKGQPTLGGLLSAGNSTNSGGTVTNQFVLSQLSSNLIPVGAVYDANGQYAVTGVPNGGLIYWHRGLTNENAFCHDGQANNNGTTMNSDVLFVAASNTLYIKSVGNSFPGSNIYSRVFVVSTNHIGGFFEGVFNGALGLNTTTNVNGNPIIYSTNSAKTISGVLSLSGLTSITDDGFSGLTITGTGAGGSHNTIVIQTTNGAGVGYSGHSVDDSAGNEVFALAAQNGNYSTTNLLNDGVFPYASGFLEVGTISQIPFFIVHFANLDAGMVLTNGNHDWTTYDSSTSSYEAMTNTNAVGTHIISQSRQEDTNFFVRNLVVGAITSTRSFTLVQTNWIDGSLNTNLTGRPIYVTTPCKLTTTGVSGNASYSLQVPGSVTNQFGIATIATSIAMSYTNEISAFVPNGSTFIFTNTSAGAGDSGAILNGGQYMVY